MTPDRLAEVLGEVPTPRGSWRREAVYVSPAAVRGPASAAEELAGRLRATPGVAGVHVRGRGFLDIVVTDPGEIVAEMLSASAAEPASEAAPGWPDRPRTWDNPGFVVRYAHVRAAAAVRWAAELGVPEDGFAAGLLDGSQDRAVLRVLAELPSRRTRAAVGWAHYLRRLAVIYHDAHERAPAAPMGDEPVRAVHTARLWLARAVRMTLAEGLTALGEAPPDVL